MEQVVGLRGLAFRYPSNVMDVPALLLDTRFGNLDLKMIDISSRLAHANLRTAESAAAWSSFRSGHAEHSSAEYSLSRFAADEAVAMLRRVADEVVGVLWLLTKRLECGRDPDRITVDALGAALRSKLPIATRHEWLAETLNELSNALKHSFVGSESSLIMGRDEPCAVALRLTHNDIRKDSSLYVVSLADLVVAFNAFLADAFIEMTSMATQLQVEAGGADPGGL